MNDNTLFRVLREGIAWLAASDRGQHCAPRRRTAHLQVEVLERRDAPAVGTYTLSFVNDTGLDASSYSTYVVGFATGDGSNAGQILTSNANSSPGTFIPAPATPLITAVVQDANSKIVKITTNIAHNLRVGDTVEIRGVPEFGYDGIWSVTRVIDNGNFTYEAAFPGLKPTIPNATSRVSGSIRAYDLKTTTSATLASTLVSGRFYYFVAPANTNFNIRYFVSPNGTLAVSQPVLDSTALPFVFSEFTSDGAGLTINVSQVDAFTFPVTINNGTRSLGNPTYANGQTAVVNQQSILQQFVIYINQIASGPNADIQLGPNGIRTYIDLLQSLGNLPGGYLEILNPSHWIAPPTNPHPNSNLNTVWDGTLNALFGVPRGAGNAGIPSTTHLAVVGDDNHYYKGIPTADPAHNGFSYIQFFDSSNNSLGILYDPRSKPEFGSAGYQVFANAGVFTQGGGQLINIERDLVQAINRGVSVYTGSDTDDLNGHTSVYWQDESKWYNGSTTMNLFAAFVHKATIGGESIFLINGTAVQGQAYGFAYDENQTHLVPAPPFQSSYGQVPPKFDNLPNGTKVTITLGPWDGGSNHPIFIVIPPSGDPGPHGDTDSDGDPDPGPANGATIESLIVIAGTGFQPGVDIGFLSGAGEAGPRGPASAFLSGGSLPAGDNTAAFGSGSAASNPKGMGEDVGLTVARVLGERIKQGDAFSDTLKPIADPLTSLIQDGIAKGQSVDQILGAVTGRFPRLDVNGVRPLIEQIRKQVPTPAPSNPLTPTSSILPPPYRESTDDIIDRLFLLDWANAYTLPDEAEPALEAPAWSTLDQTPEQPRDWAYGLLLASALGLTIAAGTYREQQSPDEERCPTW